MQKFIGRFLLFVLPLAVLAYPVDFLISKNLKKSGVFAQGEYSVWNDIYAGKVSSEIAIYGSSRAWVHVNPDLVEREVGKSAYNFGLDGHNFWLQYFRHKEILAHNRMPEYILLSVDMFTLQKRSDLYNQVQFLPYMLFDEDIQEYTKSYVGFSWSDYYIPLKRYTGDYLAIWEAITCAWAMPNDLAPERTRGYKGMELTWNDDLGDAVVKMGSYKVDIDSATTNLIQLFLVECETNNIDVILFYAPEHLEGQRFVTNRNEVIGIFNRLASDNNLLFLDYSNDSLCADKKYFYNATHLNKMGSNIFTRKLAGDIKIHLINSGR